MIKVCFNEVPANVAQFVAKNIQSAQIVRAARPAPIAAGMKHSPNVIGGRRYGKYSRGDKNRNLRKSVTTYGGHTFKELMVLMGNSVPISQLLAMKETREYYVGVRHESWKKFRDHQWR